MVSSHTRTHLGAHIGRLVAIAALVPICLSVGVLTGCSASQERTNEVTDAVLHSLAPDDSHMDNYVNSLRAESAASQTQTSTSETTATTDPTATATATTEAPASETEATSSATATTSTATTDTAASQEADVRDSAPTDLSLHSLGESVTITGTSVAYDVYAQWTLDDNGHWCADFLTNNGTTLYAYQSGDEWIFYTADGDRVVNNRQESSTGPYGQVSHWQSVSNPSTWY